MFIAFFCNLEKPNEPITKLSTKNNIVVQRRKPLNDYQLPRTSVAASSTKSTDKSAVISHAPSDENQVMTLPVEAPASVEPSPTQG